jgi:hypothetical protein
MPPLFSYEIVRPLRKFAKGPRDKIDLQILAQAADEIEGLRPCCANANHSCTMPVVRRPRQKTYANASTPKSKNEDRAKLRAFERALGRPLAAETIKPTHLISGLAPNNLSLRAYPRPAANQSREGRPRAEEAAEH